MNKLRFFRRQCFGSTGRRGLWAMATEGNEIGNWSGVFYHADRNESQYPKWGLEQLVAACGGQEPSFPVDEITASEALAELDEWPEGLQHLRNVLETFGIDVRQPGG